MKHSISNQAPRMESRNHFKNAASPKSHTSRGNFFRWLGIVAVVVFIGLSMESCGGGTSALVGKWHLSAESYTEKVIMGRTLRTQKGWQSFEKIEFFKDRTGVVDGNSITWKIENGRLYLIEAFGGTKSYNYNVSGSTLTLTSEYGIVKEYKKQ